MKFENLNRLNLSRGIFVGVFVFVGRLDGYVFVEEIL